MRVLMDDHGLGWTHAWDLCTRTFAFTNHTVLPEALERWPVSLVERLLPRHMQIVYDINWRFLQAVRARYGDDWDRIGRMSIIEEGEGGEKLVRMAYLAAVASHTVNGVAAIHSDIIRRTIFRDFYDLWPEKFQNKTNGVTQRRWLAFCNPPLREAITAALGGSEAWITDLDRLTALRPLADDPALQARWREVKGRAKAKAAAKIRGWTGVEVRTDALFDVQVKRIHEYKRQLLNVLGVVHRYDALKKLGSKAEREAAYVPRVVVIGGKAAPGYEMAKRIIKLVCAVGDKINNDPLSVFFLGFFLVRWRWWGWLFRPKAANNVAAPHRPRPAPSPFFLPPHLTLPFSFFLLLPRHLDTHTHTITTTTTTTQPHQPHHTTPRHTNHTTPHHATPTKKKKKATPRTCSSSSLCPTTTCRPPRR
jgi:starch phosphorylase